MKKALVLILVLVMIVAGGLTGCGSQNSNNNEKGSTGATVTDAQSNSTQATSSQEAGSSDFTKRIKIELMQGIWLGTPNGDDDPYQKWLNETFNVDFVQTKVTSFDQVMVRFASDDAPDIIGVLDKPNLFSLYNQGVLVDDWNKYKDKIPTVIKGMNDYQVKAFSQKGKLALLGTPSDPANWSFKIRKDWLSSLGLQMPTTPDELLNLARKFTQSDPDKNGKNDTYAFTSAGGKTGLGEISNLLCMWGPSGYYLTPDGKVSHPIIDGNWEKYLNFMRQLVKEKLIDPDWYTISWNDRKPKLFNGMYGIAWYPGVIVNECENGTGNTGSTIDWWETMPMPKGSDLGGKIPAGVLTDSLRTVSASAEKDSEKMDRILAIIENTAYPNDGFWKLRWGVDIDGYVMKDTGNGYKFFNSTGKPGINKRGSYEGGNLSLFDWGYTIATRNDHVIEGTTDDFSGATKAQADMDIACEQLPTYGSEGAIFNLDAKILDEINKLQAEFDYKYITEQENDYNAFRDNWLKSGGQKLLDESARQLKEMGFTK